MIAGAKPLPSSDETGATNLLLLLDIATAAHGDDVAVQVAGDHLNGAGVARCAIEVFKQNEQDRPRSSSSVCRGEAGVVD
jgi:hypothetical protein